MLKRLLMWCPNFRDRITVNFRDIVKRIAQPFAPEDQNFVALCFLY